MNTPAVAGWPRRIAVMGAGAVGGYYGGMLARAGHDVVLIARPAHVSAMQRDGLRLETLNFDEHIALSASDQASAVCGADLVLCCVKATDSEQAAALMEPYLDADCVVLSLQNGVDNAARLQAGLPHLRQAVVPAVVYVAAELAGPGHVRHHGRGELLFGPSPRQQALIDLFASAAVPAHVSPNVEGELWAKLVVNCAYNALSAIVQMPYGLMVQGEGVRETMRDVVDECLAVAAAEGIRLPGDVWQQVRRIARSMPTQRSSTAQDLARHKRSEIDHLNGHIVRRGQALGVATPTNRMLCTLVRLIERRDVAASRADTTAPPLPPFA